GASDASRRGSIGVGNSLYERSSTHFTGGKSNEYAICDFPWFSHDTSGILASDQAPCTQRGHRQGFIAPYVTPCLCYAPAQSRRRPACRADVAGPCGYFHHANIYACSARAPETDPCHAPSKRVTDKRSIFGASGGHPCIYAGGPPNYCGFE